MENPIVLLALQCLLLTDHARIPLVGTSWLCMGNKQQLLMQPLIDTSSTKA
jgi:hypothetical protein